jgi:hypothetical protein
VQLRVRKKDGKEAEDVLDADAGKSVWGKLWSGKPGAVRLSVHASVAWCCTERGAGP